MFKALVSIACVAVIAIAGSFLWDRYTAYRAAQAHTVLVKECDLGVFTAVDQGGAEHLTFETFAACSALGVNTAELFKEKLATKERVAKWAAELKR